MAEAHITATISGDLIEGVRSSLFASLDLAARGTVRRIGVNSYTPYAYSAYVSAVASVEAFINEALLSWICRSAYPASPLWEVREESLERMDLLLKLIVIPQLLFGSTFSRGKQPFQDFAQLCSVRNDVVHFKMHDKAPKYIQDLEQRKIALVESVGEPAPWPWKLACTEGIRWAHNAASNVAQGLAAFIPADRRPQLAYMLSNFYSIEASNVESWIQERNRIGAA